jgi:hypothetical protein
LSNADYQAISYLAEVIAATPNGVFAIQHRLSPDRVMEDINNAQDKSYWSL